MKPAERKMQQINIE